MSQTSKQYLSDQYQAIYQDFRWAVPTRFNIAKVCGERWAHDTRRASKVAIYYEGTGIAPQQLDYKALWDLSLRLAGWLAAQGVGPGDRVAIVLPQRPETAMAHLACYILGAVAVPLSMLFGEEALLYRLQNSTVMAAITDDEGEQRLQALRKEVHCLGSIVSVGPRFPSQRFMAILWAQAPVRAIHDTLAEDPALLIYTSGTTGGRGPSLVDLYQRHYRAAQRRKHSAPGHDWKLIRFCGEPELVPSPSALFLVSGRLGLDGRALGRSSADTLFWRINFGLSGPVLS